MKNLTLIRAVKTMTTPIDLSFEEGWPERGGPHAVLVGDKTYYGGDIVEAWNGKGDVTLWFYIGTSLKTLAEYSHESLESKEPFKGSLLSPADLVMFTSAPQKGVEVHVDNKGKMIIVETQPPPPRKIESVQALVGYTFTAEAILNALKPGQERTLFPQTPVHHTGDGRMVYLYGRGAFANFAVSLTVGERDYTDDETGEKTRIVTLAFDGERG